MKLKINKRKIEVINESSAESGFKGLGDTVLDVFRMGKSVGKNLGSNIKLLTKITASGFYNLFSESGSWENFRKRLDDLNTEFNREADASIKELVQLNKKMMSDAGITEQDLQIAMAATNPFINVIDLMSKHKLKIAQKNILRTFGQFAKLGESYENVIYKKLYCYYNNVPVERASSISIAVDKNVTRVIVNALKTSKTFGPSATDYFNTITLNAKKSSSVASLYRSISTYTEKFKNKETIDYRRFKTIFVKFFSTLSESIIIKNGIILEKANTEITDEYITQVDAVLTGVTAVLIQEYDKEFRTLFIPNVVKNFEKYESDIGIILSKYFHIDNVSKSVKKQIKSVKLSEKKYDMAVFIDEYRKNNKKLKESATKEYLDALQKFEDQFIDELKELEFDDVFDFIGTIKSLVEENINFLEKDDIMSKEKVSKYIETIEKAKESHGINVLSLEASKKIKIIIDIIRNKFDNITEVLDSLEKLVESLKEEVEELKTKEEKKAKKSKDSSKKKKS